MAQYVYHDGLTEEEAKCTCGAAEDPNVTCTCGLLHIEVEEVANDFITHIWPYESMYRNTQFLSSQS